VVDDILPVDRTVVERAKAIVVARQQLSARGAVHLAIMELHEIATILSFDAGFDGLPGIHRLTG
jgi:predicted nucleic acid-binding protein